MPENSTPANVNIYYQKNPLYRSIYADGLIGGPTPANSICFSFYATRNTLPKSVKHEITPEGGVSADGKLSADSKSGIMREIEVSVYLNKQTAKEIFEYLKKLVEQNVL